TTAASNSRANSSCTQQHGDREVGVGTDHEEEDHGGYHDNYVEQPEVPRPYS
ncbi:unnamed protein product, partial [Amoebophrya sp. A25]